MTIAGAGSWYDDGDEPLVAEEVVGWRAWLVDTSGRIPRLRSLMYDVTWPTDDWLVAIDGDHRGQEPHGICAARDREHLSGMTVFMRADTARYVAGAGAGADRVVAIGEVGLAGLIIPGERGYRAERARVRSILLPYKAWELVAELRVAYRVPVSLTNVLTTRGGPHGYRT